MKYRNPGDYAGEVRRDTAVQEALDRSMAGISWGLPQENDREMSMRDDLRAEIHRFRLEQTILCEESIIRNEIVAAFENCRSLRDVQLPPRFWETLDTYRIVSLSQQEIQHIYL